MFLIDTLVFGMRPTLTKWAGLLLGLSAIALLATRNFQAADASLWGVAAILAGSMCWAVGANVMKRVKWGAPAITILGWQALIGSIPLTLLALPEIGDLSPMKRESLAGRGL